MPGRRHRLSGRQGLRRERAAGRWPAQARRAPHLRGGRGRVRAEDREPVDEGFSVGVWASAGGEISSIENGIVAISGGAIAQEEAEAEAEPTMAGGSQPRGEGEPFSEAGSSN